MDTIETGCLISGDHGWHAHYMVIDFAVSLGMSLSYTDKQALARYKQFEPSVDDMGYVMNQGGLLDHVEKWLNDHISEDDHAFGWHDGEFFYMPIEWWEDV